MFGPTQSSTPNTPHDPLDSNESRVSHRVKIRTATQGQHSPGANNPRRTGVSFRGGRRGPGSHWRVDERAYCPGTGRPAVAASYDRPMIA